MAKKITRKQLLKEPDQFLTFSGRMLALAGKYRNQLIWGAASFFGLIIAIALVNYISGRSEARAFALLDQARSRYESVLAKDGPQRALEAVSPEFQGLVDDYARRAGGRMARVIFADVCARGGNFDRAVSLYTKALDDYGDQPFYRTRILISLGHALVEKKDYRSAAQRFEAVAQAPGAPMKDEALFYLGALYERMGETGKSRGAFDRIVSEFPDSIYLELSREKAA